MLAFLREAIKRSFTQFVEEIDDMSLTNLISVITRGEEVNLIKKINF